MLVVKGDYAVRWKIRFITLIEMLVVIVILSLVSGLVAISVTRLLHSQRFFSGMEQLVDQIQLAQDVMVYFDAEAKVLLEVEGGSLFCQLTTTAPLPPTLSRRCDKELVISHIDHVTYQDKHDDTFVLTFKPNREGYPSGILEIVSADSNIAPMAITLPGYPSQVTLGYDRGQESSHELPPYPQEVYEGRAIR